MTDRLTLETSLKAQSDSLQGSVAINSSIPWVVDTWTPVTTQVALTSATGTYVTVGYSLEYNVGDAFSAANDDKYYPTGHGILGQLVLADAGDSIGSSGTPSVSLELLQIAGNNSMKAEKLTYHLGVAPATSADLSSDTCYYDTSTQSIWYNSSLPFVGYLIRPTVVGLVVEKGVTSGSLPHTGDYGQKELSNLIQSILGVTYYTQLVNAQDNATNPEFYDVTLDGIYDTLDVVAIANDIIG